MCGPVGLGFDKGDTSLKDNINIVIPMVGRGTRVKNGYSLPKPLIEINGKTIAEHSISSLGIPGKYIFIIRDFVEYDDGFELTNQLERVLRNLKPDCEIIRINYVTEGPASSALLAKSFIDNSDQLIVTNCDQVTLWNPQPFLELCQQGFDGCVTTYERPGIVLNQPSPYSFIKVDDNTLVAFELKEKLAVSSLALNGIHWWAKGSDFVKSAEQMVKKNTRVNNEFYISESFNELIGNNGRVTYFPMKPGTFFALGDTDEIALYLKELENENSAHR